MLKFTMRILVASTNPNKLEGTKRAFAEFPEIFGSSDRLLIDGKKFPGNVSDQPIGYNETILGAYNRVKNAKKADKEKKYDFYVGIESGIVFVKNKPHLTTYACVMDKEGIYYFGTSILHPLPETVLQVLAKGQELAVFAEKITQTHDVRSKKGIAGYLFLDKYTRFDVNFLAVKGALAGFLRREVFGQKFDISKLPKSVYISVSIAGGIVKDLPIKIMQWVEETGAVVNDKNVVFAGHDGKLRHRYMKEYADRYLNIKIPPKNSQKFDKLIYELDTYLVDSASHLIVILEKTSFGVGMEIERALSRPARGLPEAKILGLIHEDALPKLSKMVTGAAVKYKNFVIRTYTDGDDIKRLVKEFLE